MVPPPYALSSRQMRLRKRGGSRIRAFVAFGVALEITVDDPALWPVIEPILPPNRHSCESSDATERFGLEQCGMDAYALVVGETPWIEHATLDVAVNALDQQLRLHIAAKAPGLIFVHAGVVALQGRALVIPGESFSGKTTLVRALVQSGAMYYSDEYAVLDPEGCVHPYARRLSIRSEDGLPEGERHVGEFGGIAAEESAELAVVALTRYRAESRWEPRELSQADGVVALLANAVPAQERPREALQVLRRAVRGARILEGDRGDSRLAAPQFLKELAVAAPAHSR